MNTFLNSIGPLLGLGAKPEDLTFVQISLRGAIVFIATLIMIRLGARMDISHVRTARVERSGDISFIEKQRAA